MGERSGVGMVELVILEALDSLGARSDRPDPDVGNATVLAEVERRIGLAPGYAYQVLVDLARWWTVPVRLVHGQGNYGELRDDQPASHFRHTGSRLSRAGEVVLAAERGELAPVPVGLINGNTYRDGTRPPFRPERVIEAVRQVIQRPQVADTELAGIIGMPDFLTGCTVTGDLATLAGGHPAVLRLQAHVTVIRDLAELGPPRWTQSGVGGVLIEHMPPNASRPDVMTEIDRLRPRRPGTAGDGLLPVKEIADTSLYGDDQFVCIPQPGTAPELLRDLLLDFEGITTTVPVQLPQPLPNLIKGWVRASQGEDLLAALTRLEDAIRDK
jgi:hypothetical protein